MGSIPCLVQFHTYSTKLGYRLDPFLVIVLNHAHAFSTSGQYLFFRQIQLFFYSFGFLRDNIRCNWTLIIIYVKSRSDNLLITLNIRKPKSFILLIDNDIGYNLQKDIKNIVCKTLFNQIIKVLVLLLLLKNVINIIMIP